MKTKCLICKKELPPDKYTPTMERTCPGFHSRLAQYYGYYEKGRFYLSKKGQEKLANKEGKMV